MSTSPPTLETKMLCSEDGTRLPLRFAIPPRPRAIALVLPAMGVGATYYDRVLDGLVERGLIAAALDTRGQGESPVRPARGVDFGYRQLLGDVDQAIAALRGAHSHLPLVLLGHSIGGHLAMLKIGTALDGVDAVALLATATPHHDAYEGSDRAKVWFGTRMIRTLSATLGYYPGHRLGFGGVQARTLMREWTTMARTGRYVVEGVGVDPDVALRSVRLPVMALTIEGDTTAPPVACRPIAQKLRAIRVEEVELGPHELTPRALDHLRWAREPAPVVEEIVAFLERRILDRSPTETSKTNPVDSARGELS